MSQQLVFSFKKEIYFTEQPEVEALVLESSDYRLTFNSKKCGLKMAFHCLANEGASIEKLNSWVQGDEGIFAVLKFYSYLQRFSYLGWLCHSVYAEELLIATAVPIAINNQFADTIISAKSRYILSRFAYIHQVEGQMILESPLSKMQVHLFNWQGVAVLAQLAQPCNYTELATQIPSISVDTAEQLLSLLMNAQMLSEVSSDGNILEETNCGFAQWEFHDLLFHTRSRIGRHSNPVGGTYRFFGKIDPLPAVKPRMSDDVIKLYKPDLESLKNIDFSFTQVLESRKSIRVYGKKPITAQQLGEFLYRTARVKEVIQTKRGEIASRPYPSGGALYELELYLVINQCQDIPSGLYHYDPLEHQLCLLSEKTETVEALIRDISQPMRQQDLPQVLIVIAARFQRVAWKYESIAYSIILKHVGALYQTMYLVATAMDLAPCGIGAGNSDQFAEASGCDYYAETSVGEFALGSKLNTQSCLKSFYEKKKAG
ncbi:SagB family peptide dehydrogenase [Nostoc muscorum FACHB-395]|uniref:SagB family peptide dehydrogenase n=1 Tax=Nostoc sp. C057 TaxID=2576903 RepID=UPI0015C2F728|nr:SagB family peptide dehydrogenase [Nostoc sp. C057]MBD2511514.1 SagB family peptide dehydrogenase [Desmonostoc muscorum FACHB-395]QLE53209.1 SagB/ThcOx family dehydrogenase [Nostoc sp. C057]